ncbi:phage virion morphogenesis protein [Edwardsiella tarda]|uniref:phage virion morphogenesis protein n=1 Tax=Edwardsiella tarda TaxID=636 RepID=UPI00351C770D
MNDRQFQTLDGIIAEIVGAMTTAERARLARAAGQQIRRGQQRHIAAQKNPDGSTYTPRGRRIRRTQQGIKFLWNDQVRTLRNWHHGIGRHGATITGFDIERNDIRTFFRSDIERYLEIKTRATRGDTTKSKANAMFQKLRAARFLKMQATPQGVTVGYQGRAARIARVHQFGLRDQVGAGVMAQYPARELLGLTPQDERQLTDIIMQHLGEHRP